MNAGTLWYRLPRIAVVLHDLAMVWLCWQGMHFLRYAFKPFPPELPFFSDTVAMVLIAQGLVFWKVGLYRGLWRFASTPDLVNIIKASVLGLLAIVVGLFFYSRLQFVSRTALLLYPAALTFLLAIPRMLYSAWKEQAQRHLAKGAERVLVLGAGRAGEALVRDLLRMGHYDPVGFLDDSKALKGASILGLPVLGCLSDVGRVASETGVKLLVIAMPSLNSAQMQSVVRMCEKTGVPFRTVPKLADYLQGRATTPAQLKEVSIEDLLGRSPRKADWNKIQRWLDGASVLVTGAGGSIGSELCRQCARHGARKITLLEINELALLRIRGELRRDFPSLELVHVLGDCGDPAVITYALKQAKPNAVFHAAAYKQVPLLEGQLREAVRNNVLATETVARASRVANVETFVLVSTDKAVDPVNVLGATKRLGEMVCQMLANTHSTRMVTVRFGNVLDSAGSVVPLFREQIQNGGPVTVTDPDVTRYFMTIPEACLLILQAASIGTQQAIYTLDMGEPVPIRVLAEQMIRLAGKEVGKDIQIEYVGLRPGERLHETLFYKDEHYGRTEFQEIFQAQPREISTPQLERQLTVLRDAVNHYDLAILDAALQRAVPEFHPESVRSEPRNTSTIMIFPARSFKAA